MVVLLPCIDNLPDEGLDLAIQAERATAMSVSHQADHYKILHKHILNSSHAKSKILMQFPVSTLLQLDFFNPYR